MTVFQFVVSHLDTPSQFGKDHNEQIWIFQKKSIPLLVGFYIADFFNNGVGINHPTGTLVDAFFEEHRILFLFPGGIGGNENFLAPDTGLLIFNGILEYSGDGVRKEPDRFG